MFVQLKKDYFGQKAGCRIDVDEPVARTLLDEGVADALANDPLTPLLTRSLDGLMARLSDGLNRSLDAALKDFVATGKGRPALGGGSGERAKSFGDWLVNVAIATTGKNTQQRLDAAHRLEGEYGSMFSAWQKAAMAEGSGTAGGYVVPPDYYQQLLHIAAEEATFRPNAFVQPMASSTMQFPYLDFTTAQSAGNSPFFGGVIASWTSEAQTRSETEPAFKMMELKAEELSGYSVSSNVLVQDAAFGLERFLMTLFGKAVAWYEEYAFLQGNGVGKPLGILNAAATVLVNRGTASHFTFPDVAGMLAKLLPASYTRARWYISPTVVSDLLQLKDGSNRAIFISVDQGATKPPVWKLLNLPVTITEKLPALGTKGDVLLVDPSLYVIGDRMQLEIAASEHVNFLKNQMTWRFVQRIDGKPWIDAPITLQDGTTQVSPFVALN